VSLRVTTCALALRTEVGTRVRRRPVKPYLGVTGFGVIRRAALAAGFAVVASLGVVGGLTCFGSSAQAAGEAPAPSSQIKATFGAWQMRCQQPANAQKEKCVLVQSVRAEDQPHLSLTVIFLRAFDGNTRVLRVVAPLGVLLPTGLGLKIDNADVGHVPFLKCVPNGCLAEVVVNDELIGKLKTGTNAAFILFQTPDYGVGIPVPLTGFGQGADSLN
jgi:invasion protein IalB